MPTKLPKTFTKAFTKTKLGFHIERELAKGEFLWHYDYKPKLEDNAWHPSGHCVPSVHELWNYAAHAKIIQPSPQDGSAPIGKNLNFRPMEPTMVKIFQVGHFWHQYMQEVCLRAGFCDEDAIERNGKRVWGETTFHAGDGVNIPLPYNWATGSADICPCEVPGAGPYLIDFKTMGSFQFKSVTPSPETLIKWECQLNIYMDFFDMEKAMIVGINKDTPHDFREWEFHRNDELTVNIYKKWQLVAACLDEDIEPPEDEIVELPTRGPVNA
jgi:hypothetical protein